MLGRHLVQPLESAWRDVLDRIARARGWPTTHEPAKLGARPVVTQKRSSTPTENMSARVASATAAQVQMNRR